MTGLSKKQVSAAVALGKELSRASRWVTRALCFEARVRRLWSGTVCRWACRAGIEDREWVSRDADPVAALKGLHDQVRRDLHPGCAIYFRSMPCLIMAPKIGDQFTAYCVGFIASKDWGDGENVNRLMKAYPGRRK